MKKLLLFITLFFAAFSFGFAQNKSITDTTPYKFSWKNGWVVKMNLLQPFTIGEFRFGIEKKVAKHTCLNIYGALYVPKLEHFYYNRAEGYEFTGQYNGNDNCKVGVSLIQFSKKQKSDYLEVLFFYKSYRDFYFDPYRPFEFKGKTYFHYYYQVFCLEGLYGKRLNVNKFWFLDFFAGIGLRMKFERSVLIPTSNQFQSIENPWAAKVNGFGGVYLLNTVWTYFLPTLQCGINIGINTKKN